MVHPLPHMFNYLPASKAKIFNLSHPCISCLAIMISATSLRWSRLRVRPTGQPWALWRGVRQLPLCVQASGCEFRCDHSSLVNTGAKWNSRSASGLRQPCAAEGEKTYLFSHYPPFICSADEEDHYDNYAEPGRSWLLELVAETRVEAVFSGHVHHFFANTYKGVTTVIQPQALPARIMRRCSTGPWRLNSAGMMAARSGSPWWMSRPRGTISGSCQLSDALLKRGNLCRMTRCPRREISHSSRRISAMTGPASHRCPTTARWRNSTASRRETIIRCFG